MTGESKLILVGRVTGAFGVKGEVRISAYTETPMSLLHYRDLKREDGSRGLTLLSGRAAKADFIGAAREIATKEEADALKGLRLFVARDQLPPPEEDEFYLADLVGLAVVESGAVTGKVKAVHNFGAGDVLEIEPPRGPTWHLPFTREAVPEVDLRGGRIVVERPGEVSE
jgi:16S rRNA processing protein RimM